MQMDNTVQIESIIATNSLELTERLTPYIQDLSDSCSRTNQLAFPAIASHLRYNDDCLNLIFLELSETREEWVRLLLKLRNATTAIIVAIGSSGTPRQVIDVIRSGAHYYLDKNIDLQEEIPLLFRRIQYDQEAQTTESGLMISVTSCSGGCGASSTAVNLAACLAQRNEDCGLVDLNLRGGDLKTLLNLSPHQSIADLSRKLGAIESHDLESALSRHECGIQLLASPELFCEKPFASSHTVKRILQLMKLAHSHVVVELEDVLHREQIETLRESDYVVLVFQFDSVSLLRTRKFIDFVLSSGIDPSRLCLVASRVGCTSELAVREAEIALGTNFILRIPDDPVNMSRSVNRGIPVVFDSPDSPSSRAFGRLADQIVSGDVGQNSTPPVTSLNTAVKSLFHASTRKKEANDLVKITQ